MTPEERITATKNKIDEAIEELRHMGNRYLENKQYLMANIYYGNAQRLVTIEETLEEQ